MKNTIWKCIILLYSIYCVVENLALTVVVGNCYSCGCSIHLTQYSFRAAGQFHNEQKKMFKKEGTWKRSNIWCYYFLKGFLARSFVLLELALDDERERWGEEAKKIRARENIGLARRLREKEKKDRRGNCFFFRSLSNRASSFFFVMFSFSFFTFFHWLAFPLCSNLLPWRFTSNHLIELLHSDYDLFP